MSAAGPRADSSPPSPAQVALHTEHWHHFAIIRRILLRMKSWMSFVFTEGH
jgi:hypothetical protein